MRAPISLYIYIYHTHTHTLNHYSRTKRIRNSRADLCAPISLYIYIYILFARASRRKVRCSGAVGMLTDSLVRVHGRFARGLVGRSNLVTCLIRNERSVGRMSRLTTTILALLCTRRELLADHWLHRHRALLSHRIFGCGPQALRSLLSNADAAIILLRRVNECI